ncbi:hypothetical protein [Actinoplanes philippinensis]|uniref:hypothetical protein n=1 Tax=Actinoplanes philippinensis TaxID=35752 RepID=UPI0033E3B0F5
MASIYQALATHHKTHAYPEAIEQAHTEFTDLHQQNEPQEAIVRPRPATGGENVNSEQRDTGLRRIRLSPGHHMIAGSTTSAW